jgi:pilus assembly protein Flp/PilA
MSAALSDRAGSGVPMRRSAVDQLMAFARDESGATAIEYGLIVTLISIVVIMAVTATGKNLWNTMSAISNAIGH